LATIESVVAGGSLGRAKFVALFFWVVFVLAQRNP
jgi:hypothetical protein